MHPILQTVEHRPFPLPDKPWVMRQAWCDLLFAHWPVPVAHLRGCIPPGLEVDSFDGYAWIGIVPFAMNDVYPRYLTALPWISFFLELNVRTYVTMGGVPGVYFFSLDCSNPIAVQLARTFFHLPYFDAQMKLERNGKEIMYQSRRKNSDAAFSATYRPSEHQVVSNKNSLEHFLTERYCLFTSDRKGTIYQGTIHHLPWPLYHGEAEIRKNTLITPDLGFALPDCEPVLYFSEKIETFEWALHSVSL